MARSLWDVFRSLFERSAGEDSDDDERRFVPSLLDRSVRFSHGGNEIESDRALNDVREQAEELEQAHRDS